MHKVRPNRRSWHLKNAAIGEHHVPAVALVQLWPPAKERVGRNLQHSAPPRRHAVEMPVPSQQPISDPRISSETYEVTEVGIRQREPTAACLSRIRRTNQHGSGAKLVGHRSEVLKHLPGVCELKRAAVVGWHARGILAGPGRRISVSCCPISHCGPDLHEVVGATGESRLLTSPHQARHNQENQNRHDQDDDD